MADPPRPAIAVHELAGDAGAPPLLISHATGFHAHAYTVLARRLADRFRVVGFDHRGHGATPPDAGAVDWRDLGDDTGAVGRRVAPHGGLTGFGHSMGGSTLLIAAHRDPTLFDRLVLFEPIVFPPVTGPPPGNPLAEAARRRRRTFDDLDQAIGHYADRRPLAAFDPQVRRDYVEHGFAPRADGPGVALRCDPDTEADLFDAWSSSGLWDVLADIATPVAVVGSGDGGPPAAVAQHIAERLAAGRFVAAPQLTHMGPFTDPTGMAELIGAVIDGTA